MRWLLTGGDVLNHRPPPGLPFTLVNNYGVSEATVVSTSTVVSPATGADSVPSVGRPIDGVELRVLDSLGRPLPPGADGELLICGCSVAIGYLGQPGLTAEKFVVDPVNPTERAYRTGDRARINAAGCVEFLGRLDNQVQIRGFRVEPGEVVEAAHRHPSVQACAAAPTPGRDDTELVLFVVAQPGVNLDEDDLRTYLATRLPEPMMPSRIIGLATLPTTPNGKIDRAALAHIAKSHTCTPGEATTGPRNDVEAVLANTVAGLLKRPHVAIDENFFLLGGHSMLGAQLIVRIAELYGVEITLLDLFDRPTVAELANEVEQRVHDEICEMSDDELIHAAAQLSASSQAES
ncbi:MAG: non-ribosomal peptide synthetase [Mycobacteriaceae bacterium]|nr:non-ribosomal peptide synthetase [Mycobacteriaceae bacterium]